MMSVENFYNEVIEPSKIEYYGYHFDYEVAFLFIKEAKMNTFNKKELLRKYPVGAKVKLLFMDVMLV